jgi:cytochrome c heme-lyase
MTDKCPVDHPPPSSTADKCPVDHSTTTRSPWARFMPSSDHPSPPPPPSHLSTERETSTIPRSGSDGNWVYPSEAQFFTAMARKNHDPQAADMKTIVPIHNAVNERAWAEVMKWEAGRGGDVCGGVKLINFKGKPGELSPRARWKMLLGYSRPFDRHDWVVDRCGTRMRYIIDFYTGRNTDPTTTNLSFFLDVRPAFDNWEGVKMRAERFWGRWLGGLWNNSASTSPPSQQSSS